MRVHVVVPEGFDNPGRPSGGNIYDRRVCAGLAEAGWDVLVATVAEAWPVPGPDARADLARIVSAIPDGETVLIDGLTVGDGGNGAGQGGTGARAGHRPRRGGGRDPHIPSGLGQSGADAPVIDVAAGRLAGSVEPRGDYYVDPHDVPALQSACRTGPASPLWPS